ncbi:MAG TPA: hypothetical protein VFY18_06340 [Candidatus Limnocylindrales bacterium]|nr:hypothetical protein [Candidatus Limnocylindrales bacterium]
MGAIVSTYVYIDKYQYCSVEWLRQTKRRKEPPMHPDDRNLLTDVNVAAWMIGGGLRGETQAMARERAHLLAFREDQRRTRVGLIDRLRSFTRPKATEADLVCCGA